MTMTHKILCYIMGILVCCFAIYFLLHNPIQSTEEKNYQKVRTTVTNEIGQQNATSLFMSLEANVDWNSEKERDAQIMNCSFKFGVELTEEQKKILIDYYKIVMKNKKEISSNLKDIGQQGLDGINKLKNDSKLTIEPLTEDKQFLEKHDDSITVNIPTVEKVDSIMNSIIDTIRSWIE